MLGFSLGPSFLINNYGLLGIGFIVFAETGLLVGFFLPGDSLLFAAGAAAAGAFASVSVNLSLWSLLPVVVIAATIGDQVGYIIGSRAGSALYDRPDSRWIRREHIVRSQEFFERHGARSLVLARFVPVVRTFAPVIAGVARMPYRTFVAFNVAGAVLWGVVVVLLGYFFGQVSIVKDHIELALVGVVLISLIPVAVEVLRSRRRVGSRVE
jgi:membrane-associated protein